MIRFFVVHTATGEIVTNRKRIPPDPRPDRKLGIRGRIPWPGGAFDEDNFSIVEKETDDERSSFDMELLRLNPITKRFRAATEAERQEVATDAGATVAEERLNAQPNRMLLMREAWEAWKVRTSRDVEFRAWLRAKLRGGDPV
jgi:hypothetical protein